MVCMYSTLRVVKIPSKCLGLTYTIILVGIIGYIAGFGLVYSKGYQVTCPVESVVVAKVKGTLYTKYTDAELAVPNPEFYRRVWDSPDIVTPPHGGENGGFFVLTNIIISPNQTREICPESPTIAPCTSDRDCVADRPTKNGNGVMTGKCVPYDKARKTPQTCEIHAWCPVENSDKYPFKGKRALLQGTKDFTVLVKNTIEFPSFGPQYTRRNIEDTATETYLKNCIYNKKDNRYCPTFRIGDIVEGAGFNYDNVALQGGIFAIKIKWDCSFDWGYTIKHCLPQYSFSRLDDSKAKIAPGWNFRSVTYHEENRRTLTQQYGIKFLIDVEGQGRVFDSLKFLLTVGAGLGFFALASLVCDFLLDFFCKMKDYWSAPWLSTFSEDMKYDLEYVRKYERSKYDRQAQINAKENTELNVET